MKTPKVALFIKWQMTWSGPLWRWAVERVDLWHETLAGPESK